MLVVTINLTAREIVGVPQRIMISKIQHTSTIVGEKKVNCKFVGYSALRVAIDQRMLLLSNEYVPPGMDLPVCKTSLQIDHQKFLVVVPSSRQNYECVPSRRTVQMEAWQHDCEDSRIPQKQVDDPRMSQSRSKLVKWKVKKRGRGERPTQSLRMDSPPNVE